MLAGTKRFYTKIHLDLCYNINQIYCAFTSSFFRKKIINKVLLILYKYCAITPKLYFFWLGYKPKFNQQCVYGRLNYCDWWFSTISVFLNLVNSNEPLTWLKMSGIFCNNFETPLAKKYNLTIFYVFFNRIRTIPNIITFS